LTVVVEFEQLAFVDGPDTQLALDGGNEGRTLEEGTGEGLEGASELGLAAGQLVMQTQHADILLTRALLALDEARGAVDADNQTSGDLGIEGTGVTGAVNAEDALEPGDDFVRGWVGWLVEVDDSRRDVRLEIALEWCAARGDWGEVAGANEDWMRKEGQNAAIGLVF
jgi:hypothetical protein